MATASTDEQVTPASGPWRLVARAVITVGLLVAVVYGFSVSFDFLRRNDANRIVIVAVAIVLGVVGVFLVFWAMDQLVDLLPAGIRERFRPYVFVGPALVMLSVFLVYPV